MPAQYRSFANPSDTGAAFVKSIVPYIEGNDYVNPNVTSPGSSANQLQTGLRNYVTNVDHLLLNQVYLIDLQDNPVPSVSKINSGLPFVLGLYQTSGNPYGDHWVLAIGYVYMGQAKALPLYYKVVNGWGNNDVYVNKGWTDFMVSL